MPTDIIIDTNVLVHANNKNEIRQQASIDMIKYLLDSEELLCIDQGFSFNEAQNRSFIGYEYLKHLKIGMLGYIFISTIAQRKRIKQVAKNADAAISRKINKCMSNIRDRTYLNVAYNSSDKILVTHDYSDFSISKRKYINKEFEIKVFDATDIK
jgi:predicted nucleic acid-binding protein